MAKDNKFGTFAGVFTPSVLTILGVIMYLRLPWVVGQAGLWVSLGIIAVSHVISVTTGLSISSIATDKNVGAGGPYYIVSRSLGLPIGGTLGLALFVGLSFSISLYVIGFTESLLGVAKLPVTLTHIRIYGTITVLAVTGITLVSTAFALKTQYIILTLITVSLGAIFIAGGGHLGAAAPNFAQVSDNPIALGTLFGIFFPAVTGFTAGVNMSGDLRDAKRSIPRGTMSAIFAGMVVYFGLAVFLAFRVDRAALIGDPNVLVHISVFGPLVIAGIWGATLSSAIGSIMGAPRILQALSVDRITPRFFAKGSGKTNEPRNALLLAFAIGEGGILIAQLDVIARVVSMVFLTTYGFLNLSCAIESWASPDFRPDFRIPRTVSIVGAVTCILVMIELDLGAMAGATAIMVATFALLKRRELHLASGDTWEGIWSSIVRAGLHRLSRARGQRRNWRPNVLLFAHEKSASRGPLVTLATAIIGGSGMLTDFQLHPPETTKKGPPPPADDDAGPPVGIFEHRTPSQDVHETLQATCRFHGFSGLHPNAVMLDWKLDRKDPERFAESLRTTAELDFNLMLLSHSPKRGFGDHDAIDVWWQPGQGNVSLSLAIIRFVTRFEPWQAARIRFMLVSRDSADDDGLRAAMRSLLADARLDATIRVVPMPAAADGLADVMREESGASSLTILGLPNDMKTFGPPDVERLDALTDELGPALLVRGSSMFPELLPVGERTAGSLRAPTSDRAEREIVPLPDLEVPDAPELAGEAARLSGRLDEAFGELYARGLGQALERDRALLESVRDLVERHFEIMRRGVADGTHARGRKPGARAQGGFLFQAKKQLADFEQEQLVAQKASIEGRVESCLGDLEQIIEETPESLRVIGRAHAFLPRKGDSAAMKRFKRRRRVLAWLTRRPVRYEVPARELVSHLAGEPALKLVEEALARFESTSYRTIIQLGKILNAATADLTAISAALAREEQEEGDVETRKRKVLSDLQACHDAAAERSRDDHRALMLATRALSQRYADELDRVDVARLARSREADEAELETAAERIRASGEAWHHQQTLLVQRAELGLLLAAFHHRFSAVATKAKLDVTQEIQRGALAAIDLLVEHLTEFKEALARGDEPTLEIDPDFGARFSATAASEALTREVIVPTEDLPETRTTISDEAIAEIEAGSHAEVEELSVSVRPLVQYLIESEFAAKVKRDLAGIPSEEQRAVGTAHDVTRLIEFSLGDLDVMGGWASELFREQIGSVVTSGLERLTEERKALGASVAAFEATVEKQMQVVIDGTDPYQLTTHSEKLTMYIRSREGKKAVSRVRELAESGAAAARTGAVKLLYRRSTGVLLARRLARRAEGHDAVLDRAVKLSRAATPPDAVLRSLPFYYRQLFSGQGSISETFWVGRQAAIAAGKAAGRAHADGAHGAIFVTGETGSGKTALSRVIVSRMAMKRKVFRITPPPGGSIDPAVLKRAVENEVKQRGSYERVFRDVPDGAVVLLDDFELWWERGEGGLAVIEQALDLIEQFGDRLLFVVNLNRHAYRMINSFVRLGERALAHIECEPLSAEDLKSIITLRHASTGFGFRLGKLDEEDLPAWRQARLFTRYFDYAGGLVGPALRGWLASIEKIEGTTLVMRPPNVLDGSVIEQLRVPLLALLVQLVLHKQVTQERLARITGLGAGVDDEVDRLVRMGLVRRDEKRVMHTDRFVAHVVSSRLTEMGLLR